MVGIVDVHVRGQLVGQPAHFTASHGVGLTGDGKRPHAGSAYTTGVEVAVDNGVAFVSAVGRLVDPLGEQGDHLFGATEKPEKLPDLFFIQAAALGHGPGRWCMKQGGIQCRPGAAGVPLEELVIALFLFVQPGQQAIEQISIGAAANSQVQVCTITGWSHTRVDYHQLHGRSLLPGCQQALVEHRVTPGQVGTYQHHQVGLLEVGIVHGHGIATESPLVGGNRRGHTQPRIGVDVGRADKALHQLVGHVIVFGQKLT